MKNYIEKSLRRPVTIIPNTEILKQLPLGYRGIYDIFNVMQDNIEWMLVKPKKEIRLNALRHNRNQLEKAAGLNCAFYFEKLNYYAKETMMNEGIPFIIEEKQVYLPFLGMLLAEKADRKLVPVHTISFLTQKLILCALYEKWNGMNATKIAEKLGVTKMSVSRCLDEIEYLDIKILDKSGKTRKVSVSEEIRVLWEEIKPVLRNPVIARFQLAEDIRLDKKAGISALCEFSMLSDNVYPTYAVTKGDLKETNIKKIRQISIGEEIGCEVLELGYFIEYNGKMVQDPLSVMLSLSAEDLEDERVQICIEEMLEEYVW
ncbi:MAG: hypothetical protein IJ274_15750 [Lachnospiraceae bacterium]|nr:hypothetical protein [Lachnospiraceae bacterium]